MSEWACVSVASNIDPERNIERALERLAETARLQRVSRFFVTAPIDRPEQGDYLNGMARIEGDWTPEALKFEVLRPIERALGRTRTADKYAARTLDLDITIFGNRVLREAALEIPDPDVRTRPFLAAALLDLEPDIILPDTGRRLAEEVDVAVLRTLRVAEDFTRRMQERWKS